MPRKKADPVTHVERTDARTLYTVHPSDEMWTDATPPVVAQGAIVRVKPPPDVTTEKLKQVVDALKGAGAASVKVLPAEASTAKSVDEQKPQPAQSHRQLVDSLVKSMKSHDRKALKQLVGEVMDEEQL